MTLLEQKSTQGSRQWLFLDRWTMFGSLCLYCSRSRLLPKCFLWGKLMANTVNFSTPAFPPPLLPPLIHLSRESANGSSYSAPLQPSVQHSLGSSRLSVNPTATFPLLSHHATNSSPIIPTQLIQCQPQLTCGAAFSCEFSECTDIKMLRLLR